MSGSGYRNIGPTAISSVERRRSDICLEGRGRTGLGQGFCFALSGLGGFSFGSDPQGVALVVPHNFAQNLGKTEIIGKYISYCQYRRN